MKPSTRNSTDTETTVRERRENRRFELCVRCEIHSGVAGTLSGFTRNASRHGLMLHVEPTDAATLLPAVGETVEVELEVPPNQGFGRKCLKCSATVVRVFTALRRAPEVALHVHQMDFRRITDDTDDTSNRSRRDGRGLMRVK